MEIRNAVLTSMQLCPEPEKQYLCDALVLQADSFLDTRAFRYQPCMHECEAHQSYAVCTTTRRYLKLVRITLHVPGLTCDQNGFKLISYMDNTLPDTFCESLQAHVLIVLAMVDMSYLLELSPDLRSMIILVFGAFVAAAVVSAAFALPLTRSDLLTYPTKSSWLQAKKQFRVHGPKTIEKGFIEVSPVISLDLTLP